MKKILLGLSAFIFLTGMLCLSAAPAFAAQVAISQSGPSLAIDQNATVSDAEWQLISDGVALPNSDSTPGNIGLVFEYKDADNYYYVNFATAQASTLAGLYKVTNGVPAQLVSYPGAINLNQSYHLEARKKSGNVKIYLNGTYLYKAADTETAPMHLGVLALNANATFNNTTLKTASTTSLNPTPVTTNLPPPVIDPEQSLPTPSDPNPVLSTGRQVTVSNSAELKTAIQNAQPGDTITMADGNYTGSMLAGNYTGSFAITASGTAENPITLVGSRNAVIDGDGIGGHYGLYLYGASYWNLQGFTVSSASKGIVLDGSSHNFLLGVKVVNVGQEAVHFRAFSLYNVIKNSEIIGTGKKSAQYGEGVYVGSANSNWGTYTGGQADTSNRNIVVGNSFADFTAEAIDIKEGSAGAYIANNTFEGSSISGQNSADSWIDVKGNYNLLENNIGTNTLLDGFQVHNVLAGWGANNAFRSNIANVNASGYGFNVVTGAMTLNNVVYCSNEVIGAGSGLSNIACTPGQ